MVSCFAPGCKSGYRGKKAHLFKPSACAAGEWVKILTKLRSDKRFDPSVQSHKLCSLHFLESEIVKADKFVIDGKEVLLTRHNWTLVSGAIPTIFPNIPQYLVSTRKEPRRVIKRKPLEPTATSKDKKPKSKPEENVNSKDQIDEPWWNKWDSFKCSWILDCNSLLGMVSCLNVKYIDGSPTVTKSITVSQLQSSRPIFNIR